MTVCYVILVRGIVITDKFRADCNYCQTSLGLQIATHSDGAALDQRKRFHRGCMKVFVKTYMYC